MELLIGHSPDPDDAFMFYALKRGLVRAPFSVREFLADIETLNRLALHARLDVTAVSAHVMPYVSDSYYVLRVGASMGDGYGPVLVGSGRDIGLVAVPGNYATATLILRLAMPKARTVEVPFDRIMDAVASGAVDAGLLIHEGQITYGRHGLRSVMDLGKWWSDSTGLPVPLGLDVVKSSLGMEIAASVKDALLESLKYAREHPDEALRYASEFSRGLEMADVSRFVDMYVNDYTMDMGQRGEMALRELLRMAAEAGIVPESRLEFV
ncbi:MAG: MqnA/MqnD/SBP family protein [Nitrososphaeria archaeon]|jgi:1,4-dihydroxy-6-naphthoate synthase